MSDPARPGKFSGLSRLKQQASAEPVPPEVETFLTESAPLTAEATKQGIEKLVKRRKPKAATVEVQQVRKRGKRSDPDYMQITAFVKRETYKAAQKRILDESDSGQDFSDVVDALLAGWIGGRLKV